MPKITTNDLKTGMTVVVDGEVYSIVEWQHVKPGKGGAFVRTKLRSYTTGAVLDRTFKAKKPIEQLIVEKRKFQYLYRDKDQFVFMHPDTYDQIPATERQLGATADLLKEGTEVSATVYEGQILEIALPAALDLAIAKTEPGVRGDTATGGTKPATLETGRVIQVPLFINEGDLVKVDSRTGEYLGRT